MGTALAALTWHALKHHRGWDLTSTLARDTLDAVAAGAPVAANSLEACVDLNGSGIAANLLAILIKRAHPEARPDRSDYKSMPSEHTARAFAIATALAQTSDWRVSVPAFLQAGFVAYGRVQARKHHWYDVVAGATLGIATALAVHGLVHKRNAR